MLHDASQKAVTVHFTSKRLLFGFPEQYTPPPPTTYTFAMLFQCKSATSAVNKPRRQSTVRGSFKLENDFIKAGCTDRRCYEWREKKKKINILHQSLLFGNLTRNITSELWRIRPRWYVKKYDIQYMYIYVCIYRRLGAKGSYLPLWRVSDRIL